MWLSRTSNPVRRCFGRWHQWHWERGRHFVRRKLCGQTAKFSASSITSSSSISLTPPTITAEFNHLLSGTSPTSPALLNIWMQVSDVPYFGIVRVGNQDKPIGMANITSSWRFQPFMERPPITRTPFTGRSTTAMHLGIAAAWTGRNRTGLAWRYGIFRPSIDAFGVSLNKTDYGARITGLPWYEDEEGTGPRRPGLLGGRNSPGSVAGSSAAVVAERAGFCRSHPGGHQRGAGEPAVHCRPGVRNGAGAADASSRVDRSGF